MPILIVGFAVGAYAFGSALRGSSIIVNEVGIVRGAPDATEGSASVYLGVFSPTRGTYQIAIPGGALLSSPISGDIFGGSGATLDVIQGNPSRVRNLAVGFGSLRTIRAESQATVPKIHAELALVDGTLTGFVRNDSDRRLERPAVVLGGNVKVLKDLLPGEQVELSLRIVPTPFQQSLSDKLFGQLFFDNTVATSEAARRDQTRHLVIDQLTIDPQLGNLGRLPTEGPVILAWGRDGVIDVTVEDQSANRVSNVLYYVPVPMAVRGRVTFSGDLIRSTVTDADANFFSKDPSFNFGQGSVTLAFRPIAFAGQLTVSHVRMSLGFGPDGAVRDTGGQPIAPIPDDLPPGPDRRGSPAVRRAARSRSRPTSSTDGPRSRCSIGPAPARGGACRTWARTRSTTSPMHRATSIRARAPSSSGSSTSARIRSTHTSICRSRGPSSDRHRRDPRPRQALSGHARGGGHGPDRGLGGDLRPRRTERRRQVDDPPDPRHAPDRDVRPRRSGRHRRPAEPGRRPPRPRLHAGRVRGLRRHEGLGVPGLLRPVLRHPRIEAPPDDRRPARTRRPRRQARRLRPGPVARDAAAPVPRPHPRPRPARSCSSTSRRPAWTRAPGSSSASSSASCARSARRSSSAATSCPSSRSCAPRSPSSITAACWPTARSPTSRSAFATAPSCASGSSRTRGSIRPGSTSPATRAWRRRPSSTTARSSSGSGATTARRPSCSRPRSRAVSGSRPSPGRQATSRSSSSR